MEFLLFLIFLAIEFKDIPSTKDIEEKLSGIEEKLYGIKQELKEINQKKK